MGIDLLIRVPFAFVKTVLIFPALAAGAIGICRLVEILRDIYSFKKKKWSWKNPTDDAAHEKSGIINDAKVSFFCLIGCVLFLEMMYGTFYLERKVLKWCGVCIATVGVCFIVLKVILFLAFAFFGYQIGLLTLNYGGCDPSDAKYVLRGSIAYAILGVCFFTIL